MKENIKCKNVFKKTEAKLKQVKESKFRYGQRVGYTKKNSAVTRADKAFHTLWVTEM